MVDAAGTAAVEVLEDWEARPPSRKSRGQFFLLSWCQASAKKAVTEARAVLAPAVPAAMAAPRLPWRWQAIYRRQT
jgi:hypothetical protein